MTLKKKEAGDHLPNPNWNRVEGVKGNKLFVRTGEKVGKGKEESFWPFRNWGVGGGEMACSTEHMPACRVVTVGVSVVGEV